MTATQRKPPAVAAEPTALLPAVELEQMPETLRGRAAANQAQPAPIVSVRPLYLRKPDVARYFGISVALWDQLMARGNTGAPKPRKLGKGTAVWLLDELEAWGRSLPLSDLAPPEGAGYGRRGKPKD